MYANDKQALVPQSLAKNHDNTLVPFTGRDVVSRVESLPQQLADYFWFRLPLPHLERNSLDASTAVRSYNSSIELLQGFQKEANHFLNLICRRNVEVKGIGARFPDRLHNAANKEVDRLFAKTQIRGIAVSPRLEPELFANSPTEICSILTSDLKNSTTTLVKDLMSGFENLMREYVIGCIEWPVANACRFSSFDFSLSELSAHRTMIDDYDNGFTRVIESGEIGYELTGREYQLCNATKQAFNDYERLIPTPNRDLLNAAPSWLLAETKIVEGDLFRSETHKRTWIGAWREESRQKLPKIRPAEIEVSYHKDPAATFGPYVICAWPCQERDKEVHEIRQKELSNRKRALVQQKKAVAKAINSLAMLALLQGISLIAHLVGTGSDKRCHFFGFVLSFAALYSLPEVIQRFAKAKSIPLSAEYVIKTFSCVVLAVLTWQAGFLAVSYGNKIAAAGFIVFLASTIFLGSESIKMRKQDSSVNSFLSEDH